MSKNLFWIFNIVVFILLSANPFHSFADKFFDDNDAFFLKYLKQDKFPIDTSASAIVLYECINYDVLKSKVHVRKIIKIIRKNGAEYADIVIPILNSRFGDNTGTVNEIHGTTYNLEDGKIVKQEIDEENIDVAKTRLINEKKISMPAVHEGSIVDYTYTTNGIGTSKWDVQEAIPKLYTKLELCSSPEINMITDDQIVPVFIKLDETKKNIHDSLMPYSYTYDGFNENGLSQQCWVRRNVHSFEKEPYLPCESNYREKMLIYLNSIHFMIDYGILNTWDKINTTLVESYNFYRPITEWRPSIKEKAKELAGDDTSEISIAKKIFKFVRDSISASYSSMLSSRDLSKILDARSGNSAEINLLLISLLRHAGLSCSPVILATKDNATTSAEKVEFIKYNYTICQLRINGEKYYLDAAQKYNPFGRIPPNCLNGYVRVIDNNKKDTCGIILKPEIAKERTLYAITTTSNAPDDYTLNFKLYYGDEPSVDKRTAWNKDTTEIKNYILSFFKDVSFNTKLKEYKVLNLNDPDKQLALDFSISMVWPKEGGATIYLNPYMLKFFENNPFKNPKRKYPVELPATQSLTYTFNLKLPEGYTVDEMPKSGIIKIDENDQYKNMLDYNKETNTVSIYSRLQMQRIYFEPNEYDILKELFQKMGDEQQKTLVIKKL